MAARWPRDRRTASAPSFPVEALQDAREPARCRRKPIAIPAGRAIHHQQLGFDGDDPALSACLQAAEGGTLDTDYLTSIDNRMRTPPTNPNAFLFGSSTSVSCADFSQALNPINSYAQGSDAGSYTVRAGDTLESIARNLWGDSSLWYLLASANGLSGPGSPGEGRTLAIPANVMSNAHNASTFRPYDPAKAIGDLSPTNPKPVKKAGGCGVVGMILMVVIAVAVSAVTYGALTGPGTTFLGAVLAGAASGVAGSVASQAFGLATGMQSKFDWKGVAIGAISGAIGGGLGSIKGAAGAFLNADKLVSNVAKGVLSSALSQGVGVATGLQKKFDWMGVATAGIAAGAVGIASRTLAAHGLGVAPGEVNSSTPHNAAFYANQALSGMAGALASAGARTIVQGSDFGDNILAALPDVIGSTIGNMIADPIVAGIQQDRVQDLFDEAVATEDGQNATVYLTGGSQPTTDPNMIVQGLMVGTQGRSVAETRSIVEANVARVLGLARGSSSDAYRSALAQNSALVTMYAALALVVPEFQWTSVAVFAAHQVRGQIHTIYQQAQNPEGFASMLRVAVRHIPIIGPVLEGGIAGGQMTIAAARDHLINVIADGQRMVATDIVPIILSVHRFGAARVAATVRPNTYLRAALDIQARAEGAWNAGRRGEAISLRRDAAIMAVTHEQHRLQAMWDDPLLKTSSIAGNFLGMVDTNLHIGAFPNQDGRDRTFVGTIRAGNELWSPMLNVPGGRPVRMNGRDVTNVNDRVQMATYAFNWMYGMVHTNGANMGRYNSALRALLERRNHAGPRPTI
ncbi:MAG TPA: LysM domain-containing protein [Allosphingosinicella sp.]|nr:LysM domain-containing protein [Allosphingosinicella sp.]